MRWRNELTDHLVACGYLRTGSVADAFRTVPRHLFLPGIDPASSYADEAIVTKWAADSQPIRSSSQPAIMAAMVEQLDVRPGQRVLEIGAGTGYNAALLAHLTGECAAVTPVDIDADLVEQASQHLAATGCGEIRVVCVTAGRAGPRTLRTTGSSLPRALGIWRRGGWSNRPWADGWCCR